MARMRQKLRFQRHQFVLNNTLGKVDGLDNLRR